MTSGNTQLSPICTCEKQCNEELTNYVETQITNKLSSFLLHSHNTYMFCITMKIKKKMIMIKVRLVSLHIAMYWYVWALHWIDGVW